MTQKKVLIADDSALIREELQEILKELDLNVVAAEDGVDGVEKAQESEGFDLIISDVNMPRKDGLAMVKEIKDMDKYKDTPVFVLTTEVDANLKAEGKRVGVMLWAIKPIKKEAIQKVVQKVL